MTPGAPIGGCHCPLDSTALEHTCAGLCHQHCHRMSFLCKGHGLGPQQEGVSRQGFTKPGLETSTLTPGFDQVCGTERDWAFLRFPSHTGCRSRSVFSSPSLRGWLTFNTINKRTTIALGSTTHRKGPRSLLPHISPVCLWLTKVLLSAVQSHPAQLSPCYRWQKGAWEITWMSVL